MQNHWKKHNHKIDTIFILGNPQGEENPTKLPLYKMYKIKKPKHVFSSFLICISLSPMCYISEWVCILMRKKIPLFIHFKSLEFYPNKLSPLNWMGWLHLGRIKTILYYIHWRTIDPTYNGGFTSWIYDYQLQ